MEVEETIRTKITPCPVCNYPFNSVTPFKGVMLEPGAFTVCWQCAAALRFDAALLPRLLTKEELQSLTIEMLWDIDAAQEAVKRLSPKYAAYTVRTALQ
jgi:hypothetical protein